MSTQNQAQAQAQSQNQQAEEPRAPFYLSGTMLEIIMNALAQQPYAQSAPVIGDLQAQYQQLEERGRAEMEARKAAEAAGEPTGEAEGTGEPTEAEGTAE